MAKDYGGKSNTNPVVNRLTQAVADDFNDIASDIEKLETDGIQIYYVGLHGLDTNTGKTNAESFLTFGKAITEAGTPTQSNPIAIVCSDGGVYTENLTVPTYTSIFASNATLIGNHTLASSCVIRFGIMTASSGTMITQNVTGSSGVYFGLVYLTNTANGFLSLNGSELQATGDTINVEDGYGFGGATTGSTHITANNIMITGTGIGVGSAGVGQLTANIGCIEDDGSGVGLFTSSTGIVNAVIGRISCNTAYNCSSVGSTINLTCSNLAGAQTATGTVNYLIANKQIPASKSDFLNIGTPTYKTVQIQYKVLVLSQVV